MEISNSFDTINGQSLRSNHGHGTNRFPLARFNPSSRKPSLQSLRSRDSQLDVLRSTLRSLRSQRHQEEDTATLRSHNTLRHDRPIELAREDFSVVNYDPLPPPKPIQVPVEVVAAIRDVIVDGSFSARTAYPAESRASSRRSSFHSRRAPLIKSRQSSLNSLSSRHRKHDDDSMSPMSRCWLGFLILLAQILLNGVMALCLFWVIKYHSQDYVPFAWKSNPKLEFNLHPVLMIAGFIYFMGQAMILYRTCRCCRRIWNKLLHTILHILAIPCIVIGFIAVLDSHNLRKDKDGNPAPIPNFYSLHSWIGLTAMGLFVLQFVVGFFSFLLLLCCESATASFRANLVPLHAAFGGTTFVLAVAAACTGLTEKAFFSLSFAYSKWVPYLSDEFSDVGQNTLTGLVYTPEKFEESLAINALGAGLVALAIVIPVILAYPRFRYSPQRVITVTHDRYS